MKIDSGSYVTATASDAKLTFSGAVGRRWSFAGLAWSYIGVTLSTAASLNIWRLDTAAANQLFGVGISAFGPGFIIPTESFTTPSDDDIIIELTSGGTGNIGRLNVLGARNL